MRRRFAALFIVPALLLTACGGEEAEKKDDAAASEKPAAAPKAPKPVDSADPMPEVSGEPGKKATIKLPKGDPSDKFVVHSLSAGDGPEVKKDDLVMANFTGKVWKGGKDLGSSYDKGGAPQMITAGAETIIPAFSQSVLGQKVGSRVLVVAPPAAAFGEAGQQQLGVTGKDTLVFALDIKDVVPNMAEGEQAEIPSDLPQVKADKPEPATISVPKNDPPKKLTSKTLIKGDGEEIKKGQTVYMQYSGAAWKPNEGKAKAKLFDSSWNTGSPFATQIGVGQVVEGWDKGLVGTHVGDRVMLVIPPEQGYKDQDKGEDLPANSTMVFVVDVLAAM
ncbi:FKBP-type peptidyl-prolyl cis-trans isomerase [Streptomyces sp. CZ24]|uniref:peptidylprolyl isomerase n=1 Tax=Streptomyces odorifer TaxID=53450 RepID=A0A7Y6KIG9_9ACTN|nr:FKBP-type peptidyl-prolyl cis-trans isomerase [Streptomyces albidoflavus]MBV1958263.1 FKBP-type peptidyl-prolyl cis-trans isomerase [Streptomyces sp. BV333]MDH6192293.1 FKBP-type peptidyl-prolyl cis-trans isomerase [Streptomyces sp. CZ24]NUV31628.1 FKBP-type peptidyl-prolyl cis-trans isomerase [Streptomyces odorifer]NUV33394.1 FKBP-type peptidyl-prolyl cis-trans isomerase [Streptomyces sp. KAI-27]NUV47260.1 FKBP-type peptidyl-prolyl cis-trans isomerase [Streptomyces sp. CAI-78]